MKIVQGRRSKYLILLRLNQICKKLPTLKKKAHCLQILFKICLNPNFKKINLQKHVCFRRNRQLFFYKNALELFLKQRLITSAEYI